jgi:hypothetical protein
MDDDLLFSADYGDRLQKKVRKMQEKTCSPSNPVV